MKRYKLLLTCKKNNLEQVIEDNIDNLENTGMIDMMIHQKNRFDNRNSIMINMFAKWQKWVRA